MADLLINITGVDLNDMKTKQRDLLKSKTQVKPVDVKNPFVYTPIYEPEVTQKLI